LLAKYPKLKVSWTLPILPQGLTVDGQAFLNDMLVAGIPLYRFNVMTMDYGEGDVCPGEDMGACEKMAISALADQVLNATQTLGVASQYGINGKQDVYKYLGSTPMLGMN